MVRAWTIVLGLGFLGIWLNYFAGPAPTLDGAWLAWVDVLLGAIALVVAGMLHRAVPKVERVTAPVGLATLALIAGIIGLRTIGSNEVVWANFVIAVCFFIIAGAAASQKVRTVVRHPGHEMPKHLTPKPPEPKAAPGPDSEEIWDKFGPHNLAGYEYQQRSGYAERDVPQSDGRFWGVGPKGYLRTDLQIGNEISEKMARDPELDASGIEIDVRYGDVTLRGSVSDDSAIARATSICKSTLGVEEVHNELKVVGKAA